MFSDLIHKNISLFTANSEPGASSLPELNTAYSIYNTERSLILFYLNDHAPSFISDVMLNTETVDHQTEIKQNSQILLIAETDVNRDTWDFSHYGNRIRDSPCVG